MNLFEVRDYAVTSLMSVLDELINAPLSKEVALKEQRDIVTDTDLFIEKRMIELLREKYPTHYYSSEEVGEAIIENSALDIYEWVIDPIDGTINFAHGLPLWGIQVAMVKNFETVASVIFLPELNNIFYADKTGAYKDGKILDLTKKEQSTLLIDYIYLKNEQKFCDELTKNVPPELKGRTFRKFYCAATVFSWIADGKLSGYVFTSDKAWDYTPGMYLVKQAGGNIKELVFNNKTYWLAAHNKETLENLVSAIKNSQGD